MPIYAMKLKSIDIENYANGLRDGQREGGRERQIEWRGGGERETADHSVMLLMATRGQSN